MSWKESSQQVMYSTKEDPEFYTKVAYFSDQIHEKLAEWAGQIIGQTTANSFSEHVTSFVSSSTYILLMPFPFPISTATGLIALNDHEVFTFCD